MSNFDLTLHGGVNLGLDNIRVTYLDPIVISANTTSKVDLGLDNIRIKELAPIELILGVKPTRVHFPVNYHMCFSLFGKEVMKLGLCGESMVITEPYSPHQTETCR